MNYFLNFLIRNIILKLLIKSFEFLGWCLVLFLNFKALDWKGRSLMILKGMAFLIFGYFWLFWVINWFDILCNNKNEESVFESTALVSDYLFQDLSYFDNLESLEPNLIFLMLGCVVMIEVLPLEPRDQWLDVLWDLFIF
jgi:hypothetical protein